VKRRGHLLKGRRGDHVAAYPAGHEREVPVASKTVRKVYDHRHRPRRSSAACSPIPQACHPGNIDGAGAPVKEGPSQRTLHQARQARRQVGHGNEAAGRPNNPSQQRSSFEVRRPNRLYRHGKHADRGERSVTVLGPGAIWRYEPERRKRRTRSDEEKVGGLLGRYGGFKPCAASRPDLVTTRTAAMGEDARETSREKAPTRVLDGREIEPNGCAAYLFIVLRRRKEGAERRVTRRSAETMMFPVLWGRPTRVGPKASKGTSVFRGGDFYRDFRRLAGGRDPALRSGRRSFSFGNLLTADGHGRFFLFFFWTAHVWKGAATRWDRTGGQTSTRVGTGCAACGL